MQSETSFACSELPTSRITWYSLVLGSCDSLDKPDGEVRNVQSTLLTSEMQTTENNEHRCLSASLDASLRHSPQSDGPSICPFMAFLFLIPLLFTLKAKSFTVFHFCLRNHFYSFGTKRFSSAHFNASFQWPCCQLKPWCCWWNMGEICCQPRTLIFSQKQGNKSQLIFPFYIFSVLNYKKSRGPLIAPKVKGY